MMTLFGLAFLSLLPTYLTKKEDGMDDEDNEGKAVAQDENEAKTL